MPFDPRPLLHDFPDRAYRQLLEHPHNLRELLQEVEPAVAPHLRFDQAQLRPREQRHPDWRRSEVDLLFEIPYQEKPGAEELLSLVYVLVEHQSQPDQAMPLRTLLGAALEWERQWRGWRDQRVQGKPNVLRLGPVIPVIFHTGPAPWHVQRSMADLFAHVAEPLRKFVPGWTPQFFDLADKPPEMLAHAAGEWLRTMAVVRVEREANETFERILAEVARSLEPLAERDKMRWHDVMLFLASWVRYRRSPGEQSRLNAVVHDSHVNIALREEIETMQQTVGETWVEWAERHYLAEGELRAIREVLRAQLEERFGPLPEALAQRIEACTDLAKLKACARQLVRINSPDELLL
jgi:hypothetical protein